MSFCEIKDLSFNKDQFADVLEYLDMYVMTQMLDGLDMKYKVISGGQNHAGNIHRIVVYARNVKQGFTLDLFENQTLRRKGIFKIQVADSEVDSKEIRNKLNELHLFFDCVRRSGFRSYAVSLTQRSQYVELMEIFQDQLP